MFFKLWKRLNAPPEHASIDATFAAPRMPAAWVGSPFYLHLQLEDGPMFDPSRIPGSRSLHERKTATWALLIGETYSSAVHAETRQRPHRGMLPDVDFSRAVPDHSRPSLVRRIIRLIPAWCKNRRENPDRQNAVSIVKRDCRRKARDNLYSAKQDRRGGRFRIAGP
ncbi:hypothetical protein [Mesorhizobium sp.]|uniref:hypothetical protein n=1 Tax=Mesorhizobium sp. TaxID=1871066 RepID=UPI0025F53EF8|nr:hypothetical protein [Mesorhizobium sp.]